MVAHQPLRNCIDLLWISKMLIVRDLFRAYRVEDSEFSNTGRSCRLLDKFKRVVELLEYVPEPNNLANVDSAL